MKEQNFAQTKTGKIIWEQNGMYFRFEPNLLPLTFTPTTKLINQIQSTSLALGRLDGLTKQFSDKEITLFQRPFMLKEAALSSEIEGTRSTITDVYKEEKIEEKDTEKKIDNELIRNYRQTLTYALKTNPAQITDLFIKDLHKRLLSDVRGFDKSPGNYKTEQNAIGKRDDTLDTAKFVPASPESTPNLMNNLINYINNSEDNKLLKIALTHYQFETIHPFRDGNGRLGRMLIILQLCREEILSHPLLYISEYLTRNRDRYAEALFEISSDNKIEEWLLFFLQALEYQANQSWKLINNMHNYKSELQDQTRNFSQSPNMHLLIETLFKQPFITASDVKDILQISQPAAWNLIQKLVSHKILRELTFYKSRKRVYLAETVLDILEGRH